MSQPRNASRILVGGDGWEVSIDASRRAAKIAEALGVPGEAITTGEFPALIAGYYPVEWSPQGDVEKILDSAVAYIRPGVGRAQTDRTEHLCLHACARKTWPRRIRPTAARFRQCGPRRAHPLFHAEHARKLEHSEH